jgi:hypothetical protein
VAIILLSIILLVILLLVFPASNYNRIQDLFLLITKLLYPLIFSILQAIYNLIRFFLRGRNYIGGGNRQVVQLVR